MTRFLPIRNTREVVSPIIILVFSIPVIFKVAEKFVVYAPVPARAIAGTSSLYGVAPFLIIVAISFPSGTCLVPTTLGAQPATKTTASRMLMNVPIMEQDRGFVVFMPCPQDTLST